MLPAQSSQSPVNTIVDNLLPIPKRFITGHNQDGKAIFDTTLKDELPETLVGSHKFFLGYITIEHPVDLDDNKDIKAYQQYLADPPGLALPGGSVLRYVDFPPGERSHPGGGIRRSEWSVEAIEGVNTTSLLVI
ncbi:hypothetical protein NM208_g9642 [Fusarium decemcellulare]|uniref:Uncharacterized protein n=1 Tax=Fusarium decemcellulare TaxID=57161 RepID=A0ACC1S0U3_9HYPO|nr:hypothetical protein NM208_g9642 [Fusarium decemcellulare]